MYSVRPSESFTRPGLHAPCAMHHRLVAEPARPVGWDGEASPLPPGAGMGAHLVKPGDVLSVLVALEDVPAPVLPPEALEEPGDGHGIIDQGGIV